MKRIILAIALLFLVVGACVCTYIYIAGAARAVGDTLAAVERSVQADDFPAARGQMEDSYALWQQHYGRLSALVRHNEIDDTEWAFQRARQALDNSDRNESLLQLRELRALLAHLPEMERPVLSNLF